MKYILEALKGKTDWWRILLIAVPLLGLFLFNFIIYALTDPELMKEIVKNASPFANNNLNLLLNLLPFAFLFFLLLGAYYFIHKRSITSLTTTRAKIDIKRIFTSIAIVGGLQLITFGISYAMDSSSILWNFQTEKFIPLVLIALVLLPLQIGFEEYFFRGYLIQYLGIKTKSIWFPLLTSAFFFGLAHSANPEVAEIGFKMMVFYIGTGLFLGIITILDQGMELALGFHFINNFLAATLITYEFSALQTDALFKGIHVADSSSAFSETVLSMAITYPLLLIIFSKIYKWNWATLWRK